jgi:hypothetical protein
VKKKKKRKAARSGRANLEDSCESEYDSEHDYYAEAKKARTPIEESPEEDYDEEEEEEDESEEPTSEEESFEPSLKKK